MGINVISRVKHLARKSGDLPPRMAMRISVFKAGCRDAEVGTTSIVAKSVHICGELMPKSARASPLCSPETKEQDRNAIH
jgi:hypothetical protein